MPRLWLLLLAPLAACAQPDVLTQHNNNQRTGANLAETILTTANVPERFGRLWLLPADGQIAAQPLYVSGLKTKRRPDGANTVIFCTMNNTVYAYEADRPPDSRNSTLLWARWLGPPQPNYPDVRNIDVFYTNDPVWGILSTPVIDKPAGTLFLVAWHSENGGTLRLHALDLRDGSDRLPSRIIEAADGNKKLDPSRQKQRAGLLLLNGVVYVAFASAHENETRAANGWVLAYSAKALQPLAQWCATPDGMNGGIWASGQGIAADNSGSIYLATGNGTFDGASGRRNFGNSLVKLRLENAAGRHRLRVLDFFTPCSQGILDERDLDLGSVGPVLLHRAAEVVLGGKQGRLYQMSAASLGGYRAPPEPALECTDSPALLANIQASVGQIYGSPVYWNGPRGERVYVWGLGGKLTAYPMVNGRLSRQGVQAAYDLAAQQAFFGKEAPKDPCVHNANQDAWMPGGVLAVSSNGARTGTGILWALLPANGDANRCRGIKGMLMAFDAENMGRELWRSQRRDPGNSDGPDSYGLLARFVPPTVAGGKVFVATFGDWEPRRFYYQLKRPKTHYPPSADDRPRYFYLAVYGLR